MGSPDNSAIFEDIKILRLSARSSRCLTKLGIKTIKELIKFTGSDLLKIKNFGVKSLMEIDSELKRIGLRLGTRNFKEGQLSGIQKLFLSKSIESCPLSLRSLKCLTHLGVKTTADLIQVKESDLRKKKNFGEKSLNEISSLLEQYDLCLGMSLSEKDKQIAAASKDIIYPIFQETPYDFKVSKEIESRLSDINLSFPGFSETETDLLRNLRINRFVDLLFIPYQKILLKCRDVRKTNGIVRKAYLFLDKFINECKFECNSLMDWLTYAKNELSGDRNLKKIFMSEKNIEIFKRRYCKKEQETLRDIGFKMSMSPERVRQICSAALDLLYKSLKFPYRIFIDNFISEFHKNKGLVGFDGDLDIINSFEFRLFNLIISHRDGKITFDYDAEVWRVKNKNLLIKIDKFLKKRLMQGDEFSRNQLESIALEFVLEYGFTHYHQSAISSLFIAYHFDNYQEKLFYKKTDKIKILENIMKNYFPGGIPLYKKRSAFIETLKKRGYFDIINLSERTILQQTAESENIVLWDWGVYIHKDNIRVDNNVLETIREWVQSRLISGVPRVSLYGAFFEFEEDCKRTGIPNEHALYTCMKLNYDNDFSFLNVPYIYPKKTKKRIESIKILENHLLRFKEGIKKSELRVALGLKDYQIEQRINGSDKILRWGYGRVIHKDNVYFKPDDLKQIVKWITRNIAKYNHLSIVRVFEENIVLCKKNKISTARELYSVLNKYYVNNPFLLPRYPLILNKNHGLEDDGYLSLNDLFLHYFSSRNEIITKQQIYEYFVEKRGYRKETTDMVTELCDDIVRYTKNSFVSLETIGWSDNKASTLEKIALKRFEEDSRSRRPFSFIEDLLEMESLPPLERNISWQKVLLIELLRMHEKIKVIGDSKEIYVFVPNDSKIEKTEDLIHHVLREEFGGAANRIEFLKRLKELRITRKLNPANHYTRFAIKGEEVFIK